MTLAVSSWALHRTIGTAFWNSPENDVFEATDHSPIRGGLFNLMPSLRDRGYSRLELCHFHLAGKDENYLRGVRSAMDDAGLVLQTLLIDNGDITDPIHGDRDREWIRGWVIAAHELGAQGVRVIAGKQGWSDEAVARCVAALGSLSSHGMRVRIENWFDLLQTPEQVHALLDRLEGRVGLCVDLGNWSQPHKYARLQAIAGRAETCHAKCEFLDAQTIDAEDYKSGLNACSQAGFVGPYVLVNGGIGDSDWDALEQQRAFIMGYS